MNTLEKRWIGGLALGGAVIVVLAVAARNSPAFAQAVGLAPTPQTFKPPVDILDIPAYPPIDLGNITINTAQPSAGGGCDCGCQQPSFLGTFQALADEYTSHMRGLESQFEAAILATVPQYDGGSFQIALPFGLANIPGIAGT